MPSRAGPNSIDRFMRLDEVLQVTGLSRNTVYRRIREGTFPKQLKIGPNSVAWRQSMIVEWMGSFQIEQTSPVSTAGRE
jgi:prophage regulatory protein